MRSEHSLHHWTIGEVPLMYFKYQIYGDRESRSPDSTHPSLFFKRYGILDMTFQVQAISPNVSLQSKNVGYEQLESCLLDGLRIIERLERRLR